MSRPRSADGGPDDSRRGTELPAESGTFPVEFEMVRENDSWLVDDVTLPG